MERKTSSEELRQVLNFDFDREYYAGEKVVALEEFSKKCIGAFFAERHADNMNYTFEDLRHYLLDKGTEYLGEECEELQTFRQLSKEFNSYLQGLLRGQLGELHTQWALDSLNIENIVIPNVELRKGDIKAEIDYVVITPKHIYQIEVKNPCTDVVVDANGNYFKMGQKLRPEYNLGTKNNYRDQLLREVIGEIGIPEKAKRLKIEDLFMIANNQVTLDCRYKYVKKCNEATLPHLIDNCLDPDVYSLEQMEAIADAIRQGIVREAYAVEFDMKSFIESLITVTSMIENASQEKIVFIEAIEETKSEPKDKPLKESKKSISKWDIALGVVNGMTAMLALSTCLVAFMEMKNNK